MEDNPEEPYSSCYSLTFSFWPFWRCAWGHCLTEKCAHHHQFQIPQSWAVSGGPKVHMCSESILPSFSASFPASFQSIHPHTMMFLPQKFHCFLDPPSINPSVTYFHTHCFPSDQIVLVLVSYDQITLFQSSTAQSTDSSHALQ